MMADAYSARPPQVIFDHADSDYALTDMAQGRPTSVVSTSSVCIAGHLLSLPCRPRSGHARRTALPTSGIVENVAGIPIEISLLSSCGPEIQCTSGYTRSFFLAVRRMSVNVDHVTRIGHGRENGDSSWNFVDNNVQKCIMVGSEKLYLENVVSLVVAIS